MNDIIIEFKDVKKVFGNKTALNGLNFSVYSKEFVAIVGNNGSGKSTTINTLCNLIPYNFGSIKIFNKTITPYYVAYRSKIGAFLSEPILIKEFTPSEYLRFVCRFHGINDIESKIRVKGILELFKICDSDRKRILDFSSGDKVKISLAAALVNNPELLILDEPFVHLDNQSLDMIINILLSFKGKKTMLVTSHNLDLIFNLCESIFVINEGEIVDHISNSQQASVEAFKEYVKHRLINKKYNAEIPNWLI